MAKARETTGLDQTQFGAEMGVSRGTVSRWERGLGVKKMTVLLYAMRTGVPEEWIEFGVRPPGLEPGTHCIRVGEGATVTPLRPSTAAIAA